MKTQLDPTVFLKAAELVASGKNEFCCDAIMDCTDPIEWAFEDEDPRPHQDFFGKMFKPKKGFGFGWWIDGDSESRVLALLLCVEILKSR
jgi:hypothetical protein